jgi:hypothetical protein
MLDAVEAMGDAGAWQIAKVLAEAWKQEAITLDVRAVSAWAGVKKDRAAKLLVHAQKILDSLISEAEKSGKKVKKSEEISKKSQKISENLEEISKNLVDFEPETRVVLRATKNRIEENREEETTTTPLPPSDPKPPAAGSGCFFMIVRGGNRYSEEEWLRLQAIELIRAGKRQVDASLSLHELESLHYNLTKTTFRWRKLPLSLRMAAFGYTVLHSNASNELVYALKAAESSYPAMVPYLKTAEKQVSEGDYEVNFDE